MHRAQYRKAQNIGNKYAYHLGKVCTEQKLYCLADVVIYSASLAHRGYNGGKVIVRKHHIRHILCNIGAGDAHAHAYIGAFYGGRIVYAVPRHGHNAALCLPRIYYAHLVLRLHAGIYGVLPHAF